MHLTVLAMPGCPNAPVLRDRLAAILDDRAGASVSRQVISDETEAARWGMHGSPTFLIDGVDPFAEPGQPPSLSCRLYRDEHGRTSGAPSVGQLRQAIGQVLAAAGAQPSSVPGARRDSGPGGSAGLGRDEKEPVPAGHDRPGAGVLVQGAEAVPVFLEAVPRD